MLRPTGYSPMTEKLKMLHKGKRIYAITHGFDPEKMSDGKANLTSKFTITYTGQIYTKHNPSKLLVALKDLISERVIDPKDVDVRFYGPENNLLAKKIEEYGLSAVVRQCGVVPREISFEKQRESQLLLLLKWEDPRERGLYSGKVFDFENMQFTGNSSKKSERARNILRRHGIRFKVDIIYGEYREWSS